ncbi:branched-subunit amino acid aminotransferase/4-amino-4-deoxychorismate lyase [Lewinella marina]|uniref:branched-chain-amino-acid transaminase n=1 Tax=Neolewinella marina TaxID=438751 RepID=A0A2G0CFH8_9BACT|nr:aminotransferase class IV [Neolewinella marina]NJB85590.1 branched-subunit amino acid aminotransferase/4-amino-4-deoxychorismate lyase [Neolewinella marina]PHK98726.1 aminotransferase IV [Neolewinella marina]
MLDQVYLNGAYLAASEAHLHVSDLSILRGYGVFDYFRVINGKPRFITDHLDRFRQSAAGLELDLPLGGAELGEVIQEVIDRNGPSTGGIRTILTGGYAGDGYTPQQPNLLVLPYTFTPPAPTYYAAGCTVMLHEYERQLPRVKSIDYLEGIRIQPLLRERSAQYPLYVDRRGCVRESDRSNFMIVVDGRLITPVDDVLLGITRRHLLRLAGQLGIPFEERDVTVEELLAADEAIICSSIKGAMPITRVDDQLIGGGDAGAITRQLMEAWREYA